MGTRVRWHRAWAAFVALVLMGCVSSPAERIRGGKLVTPALDLPTLLDFEGYKVRVVDLSPESGTDSESSRLANEILKEPRFEFLLEELKGMGYRFPPGLEGGELSRVSVGMGRHETQLTIGIIRSEVKQDTGTQAAITVALDALYPERSIIMAHVTNVYGTTPDALPKGSLSFNGEPYFTVQVGIVPFIVSGSTRVIWYRYWWYDSHRHKNWWYGCYYWYWCWYSWHGKSWWWWYDWYFGWYHWKHWWFWSRLWVPHSGYDK